MALSTRRGGRARFTLILLILTSITLLTLDFRGFAPLNTVRSAVLDAFQPVGDFASDTLEPVSDAWNGAFGYDAVEKENDSRRIHLQARAAFDRIVAFLDRISAEIPVGRIEDLTLRRLSAPNDSGVAIELEFALSLPAQHSAATTTVAAVEAP